MVGLLRGLQLGCKCAGLECKFLGGVGLVDVVAAKVVGSTPHGLVVGITACQWQPCHSRHTHNLSLPFHFSDPMQWAAGKYDGVL